MTIPELINNVLDVLRNQHYAGRPPRDYVRDERFLIAAIATYGKECKDRGWLFDAPFLQRELLGLLMTFKKSGVEVTWMPIYLQGAIRRHIGQRAEELQASARNITRCATKIVAGVQPVAIIEPSDTELLARLYNDVRKLRRQRTAARKIKVLVKRQQPSLL